MSGPILELKNVSRHFGAYSLQDFCLHVPRNAFVTLLGPSGCGKTTVLRLIGGLDVPDTGSIFFEDQNISRWKANKREVNTVFQDYALFPHMNVFENIAFGLTVKGFPKVVIRQRVEQVLQKVGLKGFAARRITSLSGGQQQRVAIARAIINEPKVLLLDEPLAALDLKLRREMQQELKVLQRDLGITFIFVTHDQEEALALSDWVVVMNHGIVQQMGTPQDIYNEPINAFVADFVGESNIFPAVMMEDYQVSILGFVFACEDRGFDPLEPVETVIRPEDIQLVPPPQHGLVGLVESITFQGVHYEIVVRVGESVWLVHSTKAPALGQSVGFSIAPDGIHVMRCSVGAVDRQRFTTISSLVEPEPSLVLS